MQTYPKQPESGRPWRSLGLLAASGLLLAGSLQAQTTVSFLGWDTKTAQNLTYHIDVDMDCDLDDPSLFHERDVRTLQVKIGSDQIKLTRTSRIESSTEHFGPYAFAADGSITLLPDDPAEADDQKAPPMEALLLLRVFSRLPQNMQPGNSWTYLDPATNNLSAIKLEIQQKSIFTHLSSRLVGGFSQYTIDLASELKLIDNLALAAVIGSPGNRPADVAAAAARLSQDGNLFLYGNLVWEARNGATVGRTYSADLTYIAIPFAGGTRSSIGSSVYRQHMIATLLP